MLDADHEHDLLAAVRAGDRHAAEGLVDRTYTEVYASLVRLTGDRDRAADLTQETYRKAWRSIAKFDGRSRLATWLYRIAYTTFLNDQRRPRLVQPAEGVEMKLVDETASPHHSLHQRQDAERLRRAVLDLPKTLRYTVTARYWGELSTADIARQENVSGAAIRKRLASARALIRQFLEEISP